MKILSDWAIRKLWLPMYSPGKMAGPLHPHYGYGQKEAGRAIARKAEQEILEQVVEFIDGLDDGVRSSPSWREEIRKFRLELKKQAEEGR